jgi:hypothetical protein
MVIFLLIIPYIHRIYVFMYGFGQPYIYRQVQCPSSTCRAHSYFDPLTPSVTHSHTPHDTNRWRVSVKCPRPTNTLATSACSCHARWPVVSEWGQPSGGSVAAECLKNRTWRGPYAGPQEPRCQCTLPLCVWCWQAPQQAPRHRDPAQAVGVVSLYKWECV